MKNVIQYLFVVLFIIVICVMGIVVKQSDTLPRYHQHLEQKSEEELGQCTKCDGKTQLCTHLPIITIDTGGQKIPGAPIMDENYITIGYEKGTNGEELIEADISTIEKTEKWHHLADKPTNKSKALIRYRGNTSRAFEKHSFLIKLVESEDTQKNRDLSIMGMEKDNEWALNGPFLDKTLIRNYIAMNLAGEIMGYAPNVRFCELVLDGEYQGVYLMMETIKQGEGRVNITKNDPNSVVTSYIVRNVSKGNSLKTINTFSYYSKRLEQNIGVELIYPGLAAQNKRIKDYVASDISDIEGKLYSPEIIEKSRKYKDMIDVQSFVDYYIIEELLAINDAFSESTYFHKDVRGKLKIGPVWDFNNSLDNYIKPIPMDELLLDRRGWYGALMKDDEFVDRTIKRYKELRKNILSDQFLNEYIDETVNWLGGSVDRNYQVWGYTFDYQKVKRPNYCKW